jgi:hypothetical protein
MPKARDPKPGAGETPRTNLPPERIPYDDEGGDFGQGEEEGVVKERQADADRAEHGDDDAAA